MIFRKSSFPFFPQHDEMDCGAACLRMILAWYGLQIPQEKLRQLTFFSQEGVSLEAISETAEKVGLLSLAAEVGYEEMAAVLPLPLIALWEENHFVVVYKANRKSVWIADPAVGKVKVSRESFIKGWSGKESQPGVVLLLQPSEQFRRTDSKAKTSAFSWGFIWPYLRQFSSLLWQLVLGIFVATLLQLVFPFVLQAIVDYGVQRENLNFITLILTGYFLLVLGKALVEIIRNWVLLHIGQRLQLKLLSDFVYNLLRMPLGFFHQRYRADLLQRIGDNKQLEYLLTQSLPIALFSFIQMFVMALILGIYHWPVLLVYLSAVIILLLWGYWFRQRRKNLDFRLFDAETEAQGRIEELIDGLADLRNYSALRQKRWEWERAQVSAFSSRMAYRSMDQWHRSGVLVVDELKNVLITYLAALAVVNGQLTLGMMMAVMFMVGQLNFPINYLMRFSLFLQQARLSLERLQDVLSPLLVSSPDWVDVPEQGLLQMEHVSFRYEGASAKPALYDVSLEVPYGKTTAIIGPSGSGKTTLVRLLMGHYLPSEGKVKVSGVDLQKIDPSRWLRKCAAVMSESILFRTSIARNVVLGSEPIDALRLSQVLDKVGMLTFVESLPNGWDTEVGRPDGGLSQGQKQKVLLARLLYADAEYLFLDEATNALDAFSEMLIFDELADAFLDKTVVFTAHRPSALKYAHYVVVLEDGEVVEKGAPDQLLDGKGPFYHMMKAFREA